MKYNTLSQYNNFLKQIKPSYQHLPRASIGFSNKIKIFNFSLTLQLGDSIVHKARETLERAIKLVNDTKKWGAHVVYGDTDR